MFKKIFNTHFELGVAVSSTMIVVLAIAMDLIFFLQACPMCILTRYVFGTFSFFSLIAAFNDRFKNLQNILIFGSLFFGVGVTSRQIYIQNLSSEGLTNLSGCGMPLETTIEFYGFFGGIYRTLQGA